MKEPLSLPDPVGAQIIHTEKVYVPVKDHPEVSFKFVVLLLPILLEIMEIVKMDITSHYLSSDWLTLMNYI